MNLIDTNAGGWRLQAVAGAINAADNNERDRLVAENYHAVWRERIAAQNDPEDMTFDF